MDALHMSIFHPDALIVDTLVQMKSTRRSGVVLLEESQ